MRINHTVMTLTALLTTAFASWPSPRSPSVDAQGAFGHSPCGSVRPVYSEKQPGREGWGSPSRWLASSRPGAHRICCFVGAILRPLPNCLHLLTEAASVLLWQEIDVREYQRSAKSIPTLSKYPMDRRAHAFKFGERMSFLASLSYFRTIAQSLSSSEIFLECKETILTQRSEVSTFIDNIIPT